MLPIFLMLTPTFGTLIILVFYIGRDEINENIIISTLIVTELISLIFLIIWVVFGNNCKYFQFVEKQYILGRSNFYLGLDAYSIYFILLITLTSTAEYLYNVQCDSSLLMSRNWTLLFILIIYPGLGFYFLASKMKLGTSLTFLLFSAEIFISMLYVYTTYGIDQLYTTLTIIFLLLLNLCFTIYISDNLWRWEVIWLTDSYLYNFTYWLFEPTIDPYYTYIKSPTDTVTWKEYAPYKLKVRARPKRISYRRK